MKRGKYIRTEESKKKSSESHKGLQVRSYNPFFGRKHSKETKEKISKANKGKIGYPTMLGKKHSKETKEKMRLKALGNKRALGLRHTEEVKRKIAESNSGERSNLWKGGITPLYAQIRSCMEYKIWRLTVYKRDNYTCTICGDNKGGNLEADHKKAFSLILRENNILTFEQALNCNELWDADNGRTLCRNCHQGTPNWGWKAVI